MDIDEYQRAAVRTCTEDRGSFNPKGLSCHGLGIAGEAGEVADMLKKHLHHGHELDHEKLIRELGDVLWYIAALTHDIGADLSTVARVNVEKLLKRYPSGFRKADSINRTE
jgi:NTP pyrophosphatase (non-canonical NTP hydrolase)